MAAPRISIVIDNFNYQGYLAQSIDSALGQRYPDVEVVVVDDASTDGSREVMARYGDRIVAVSLAVNGGQGAAFNAGIRASRGELVMLLDSDDYLYPQAAERVAAAWRPGLSKIHYRLHLVDSAGTVIDLFPPPEVGLDGGDVVPLLLRAGRYETTVTSGNAYTRAALERVLPVPEPAFRISADGYLATVAPFHGPVATIEEPLGAYRLHGANAWAGSSQGGGLPALSARFRRSLEHDRQKDLALRRAAGAAGLDVGAEPGLRDYLHVETRLASLLMDPAHHPYPGDSVARLGWHGARAVLHASAWATRRITLALWFLLIAILPRSAAARLASWRLAQASRPAWVDRILKQVRQRFLTRRAR